MITQSFRILNYIPHTPFVVSSRGHAVTVGMTLNLEPSHSVSVDSDSLTSTSSETARDRSAAQSHTATQLRFDSLTATEAIDRAAALASLQAKTSYSGEDTIGEQVADLSRLRVPDDPVLTSYYIQAAQVNHRAFLTTNLSNSEVPQVTVISSTWLLGRSRNCAVVVQDRSVSRCHAVVGYDVQQGFYVMDVGSSNGTCLNNVRLAVLKRYPLKDGDVIAMCNIKAEFFIANDPQS
jgi:FHA domain